MTHGETYVYRRNNIDFTKDIDVIARSLNRLPERMKRNEALKYYGMKIEQIFIKPKNFLKPNDYFDYFEATRLIIKIRKVNNENNFKESAKEI